VKIEMFSVYPSSERVWAHEGVASHSGASNEGVSISDAACFGTTIENQDIAA
jgi:hypothetical protein